jgi:hypothetical protein
MFLDLSVECLCNKPGFVNRFDERRALVTRRAMVPRHHFAINLSGA